MKRPYEKPVINKLRSGLMNKFGWSPAYARKDRTAKDGVSIYELCGQFGSTLFVYSERTARRTYRQMFTAVSTRYPKIEFGWSYKTNYLQAICALMHQEGAIAEVVSAMAPTLRSAATSCGCSPPSTPSRRPSAMRWACPGG